MTANFFELSLHVNLRAVALFKNCFLHYQVQYRVLSVILPRAILAPQRRKLRLRRGKWTSSHNYVWRSQKLNPGVFTPEPMNFSIPQVASGVRDPEQKLLKGRLAPQASAGCLEGRRLNGKCQASIFKYPASGPYH